jgi:hypothetical protein
MRIISFIAAFTFALVVCVDGTPTNPGVAEATSLQTRHLRGEAYQVRIRPYTPLDSTISSKDDSTSAEAPAGGGQAPPIRQKKSTSIENEAAAELLLHFKAAATINNGGGAATTTGLRPPRRQNNQYEDESTSVEAPAATGRDHTPPFRKRKSQLAPNTENGDESSREESGTEPPPKLRRQYGHLNLNKYDTADSPASFLNIVTRSVSPINLNRPGIDRNDPLGWLLS